MVKIIEKGTFGLLRGSVFVLAALACGVAPAAEDASKEKGAVEFVSIAPERFKVKPNVGGAEVVKTFGTHNFGGEERPAICLEVPWSEKGRVELWAENFLKEVDALKCPTVDIRVESSELPCKFDGKYYCFGGVKDIWGLGSCDAKGLCIVHREFAHETPWAVWADPRRLNTMSIGFGTDSWTNTSSVAKIWISDIRFTSEDSWAGTDRGAAYREWVDFCDNYEPDLSDGAKFLEPPEKGRLKKPLKLVENHVARAEIVAPKDYYNTLELVARDLQHWIRKMTGAELKIVEKPTDTVPIRIFLNAPEAHERWAKDVEWLKGGKDCDGWFVHTAGNDIHIGCAVPNDAKWSDMKELGLPTDACPIGTFRGMIAFLENNTPILFASPDAQKGTVYDETPDFVVRWGNGRSRPATCGRGWLPGILTDNRMSIDFHSLMMWNARTGGNIRMPHRISGHANQSGEMIEYVPHEAPYQTWDGEKRLRHDYNLGQICLGAPDCLDHVLANGIHRVDGALNDNARYPIVSVGFWNEDNWKVCICDECTKPIKGESGKTLTSLKKSEKTWMDGNEMAYRSTQYMQFVNKFADALAKKRPGVKVEILAYLFQRSVPDCPISDNVAWTYCPYFCRWSFTTPYYHPSNAGIFDNFTELQKKGGEMHLYEYHCHNAAQRANGRMPLAVAGDYRYLAAHGAKMIGFEYIPDMHNLNTPNVLMNTWLVNRVGWHASLKKVEGLKRQFLRRLYREGAPAAEEFYARYHRLDIRTPPLPGEPAYPAPFSPAECSELFNRYLGEIKNPIAKWHYKRLMRMAGVSVED